jgi:hypothetical protein
MRTTDVSGRIRLKSVTRVTLCTTDEGPPGRGCVGRIDLDFSLQRRNQRGAAVLGSLTGGTAAAAGVAGAVLGPELALLAVPGGGILALGAWFMARSSYSTSVDRAVSAIELVLDDLERGR